MLKNQILVIWTTLIILHVIIVIVLPGNPNPGVFLIYATIALLSGIGFPVFIPHSGWGLPMPNLMGWSLGVLLWIVVYLGIAYILARLTIKYKGNVKDKNIKTE